MDEWTKHSEGKHSLYLYSWLGFGVNSIQNVGHKKQQQPEGWTPAEIH